MERYHWSLKTDPARITETAYCGCQGRRHVRGKPPVYTRFSSSAFRDGAVGSEFDRVYLTPKDQVEMSSLVIRNSRVDCGASQMPSRLS